MGEIVPITPIDVAFHNFAIDLNEVCRIELDHNRIIYPHALTNTPPSGMLIRAIEQLAPVDASRTNTI